MGNKYVMQDRAFYRLGVYSPPGVPFEIAEGTRPPAGAVQVDDEGYRVRPEPKKDDTFAMSDKPKAKRTSDVTV